MLGIQDPGVWLAYILCILSAAFCAVYGFSHWNKGEEPVYTEDKKWVEAEKELEEKL